MREVTIVNEQEEENFRCESKEGNGERAQASW